MRSPTVGATARRVEAVDYILDLAHLGAVHALEGTRWIPIGWYADIRCDHRVCTAIPATGLP